MFLKKEPFEYEGEKTVLCELSGLQRIDYLAFVSEKTALFDDLPAEIPQQECTQAFMKLSIEINAWLISRSLAHLDNEQDEDALYQQVLHEWSYDAIAAGADKVLALSGMIPAVQDEVAPQATSPEKP
ncbi:phage tail assembly chaperone G [Hafnia paralvei]|uniref:phage tail assembly chaperone G n=1 Tax=Hafnia paralvei TaxID=546367 RepID=UPI0010334C05|nr:phage minor tail protein G [Hafnia paralvei]TBL58186.1 phage minor tail protein G [Hafnia paralvei]